MNKEIYTIASSGYADGPSQALRDYLVGKNTPLYFITHPLSPESQGVHSLELYEKGEHRLIWSKKIINKPPATYIFDILLPIIGPRCDIFVGFNNLSALKGLFLRALGRNTKVVYWAVDFVPGRFGPGMLTRIYDMVDKYVCEHSNMRIDLSLAALDGRTSHHKLSDKACSRSFVFPMGAWLDRTPKVKPTNFAKMKIVYMGHLVERQGVDIAIRALAELRKVHEEAVLDIIGSGPMSEELKKLAENLNIAKFVRFHGFIKDHKDLESILASCTVAVAPYRRDPDSFTQFADPGKLKAYLGAHLPIVLTDVPPNARDLEKRGAAVIAEDNPVSISMAIAGLFDDREKWRKATNSSAAASKEFDWATILKEFEEKLSSL